MIPDEHQKAHEVQLIGWGEHCTTGPWIKFRVDDEAYARFKEYNAEGKNQQRFHLVAVPIADNEGPLETKPRRVFGELSRAQQAGILCAEQRFQQWLWISYSTHRPDLTKYESKPNADTITADMIRAICVVQTRKDLDSILESGKIWDSLVRHYREVTQLPEQRPGTDHA